MIEIHASIWWVAVIATVLSVLVIVAALYSGTKSDWPLTQLVVIWCAVVFTFASWLMTAVFYLLGFSL